MSADTKDGAEYRLVLCPPFVILAYLSKDGLNA